MNIKRFLGIAVLGLLSLTFATSLCVGYDLAGDAAAVTRSYEALQKAIKDRSIEDFANRIWPLNILPERRRAFVEDFSKASAKDMEEQWSGMSSIFVQTGTIRYVDIIELSQKGETNRPSMVARVYIEGIVKQTHPNATNEVPCLVLYQGLKFRGEWFFALTGGDAQYFSIVPRADFSTPQKARRSVGHARYMLDWATLYDALSTSSKIDLTRDDYRRFVVSLKYRDDRSWEDTRREALMMDGPQLSDEDSGSHVLEEMEPLKGLRRVRVERDVFVQEKDGWRWVPEKDSSWLPKPEAPSK